MEELEANGLSMLRWLTRGRRWVAAHRVAPMKHAGPATLARISTLLEELRARPVLRETRPGVFALKSRAFLHFHDDPGGIFADVRLAEDFVRLPVTTRSEQADLLDRIDECLSTIESRATDGRGRRGRQRG
jgi:hypothetical protein